MLYYVNTKAQANGDHEVHTSRCSFIPQGANRLYVGDHASCGPAVAEAKQTYPRSNGCFYCCPNCNTG
jgi:hypothetical protein